MSDQRVCPRCGQVFDSELEKCPLCDKPAQVYNGEPVQQRKRLTDAERRQRRAERKEADAEARLRRKEEKILQDAEEERRIEEEHQRRKEEKRRQKEARRPAKEQTLPAEEEEEETTSYTPVITPGPDRTKQRPTVREVDARRDRTRTPRIFLILSTLVLLATLIVGGSYLLWKLDVVDIPIYDELLAKKLAAEGAPSQNPGESGAQQTESTGTEPFRPRVNCTALTLDQSQITLTHAGDQTQLTTVVEPADTTDERIFQSSDDAVVKVSQVGIVTAVAPGSAVITVTCGANAAQCTVICEFEDVSETTDTSTIDHLALNKDDMTFFNPGENYALRVTNVPGDTEISWKSLDETIATVDENGYVTAVGPGTTRVIATVDGLSAECWVRCRFE